MNELLTKLAIVTPAGPIVIQNEMLLRFARLPKPRVPIQIASPAARQLILVHFPIHEEHLWRSHNWIHIALRGLSYIYFMFQFFIFTNLL